VKSLKLPKKYFVKENNGNLQYNIMIPKEEPLSLLLNALQKQKLPIQEIHREKPDLAEAIKKMYGKEE
jgi:hypothetical protein